MCHPLTVIKNLDLLIPLASLLTANFFNNNFISSFSFLQLDQFIQYKTKRVSVAGGVIITVD